MGNFPKEEKVVKCVTGRNVRYLCPQQLVVSGESEKVSVYFRVLQPELNVRLIARCGDTVIASKKEFRVNPGEMCHVNIDTALLSGDTVTVEVAKED